VLIGLVLQSRRVPRHGYPVLSGTSEVGLVTSGGPSPSLGMPIAMAYVSADAGSGPFFIDVRGRGEPASVTALPFYSRKKA
jgi:aminomethyltransferase